jgi:hypothetical protein
MSGPSPISGRASTGAIRGAARTSASGRLTSLRRSRKARGSFWTRPGSPTAYAVLGSGESADVLRSDDAGLTWAAPAGSAIHKDVLSLALDPDNKLVAIAGTPTGLSRTDDGGVSWSHAWERRSDHSIGATPRRCTAWRKGAGVPFVPLCSSSFSGQDRSKSSDGARHLRLRCGFVEERRSSAYYRADLLERRVSCDRPAN